MLFFLKKSRGFILFKDQKFSDGFTLVELLVVIAIIGLLASVASVIAMEARKRGRDTGIQASLAQARFEAALIHNSDKSYVALCDASDTLNDANDNLRIIEDGVRKYAGVDPICYAAKDTYCVQSPLNIGGYYCLDSTGFAGKITDSTYCPANTRCP
ncbi:type II secretion system protein [Patescibacteria group bacterium]|nr:type II secretion system protein [Patescibacteria group bacterium]